MQNLWQNPKLQVFQPGVEQDDGVRLCQGLDQGARGQESGPDLQGLTCRSRLLRFPAAAKRRHGSANDHDMRRHDQPWRPGSLGIKTSLLLIILRSKWSRWFASGRYHGHVWWDVPIDAIVPDIDIAGYVTEHPASPQLPGHDLGADIESVDVELE